MEKIKDEELDFEALIGMALMILGIVGCISFVRVDLANPSLTSRIFMILGGLSTVLLNFNKRPEFSLIIVRIILTIAGIALIFCGCTI